LTEWLRYLHPSHQQQSPLHRLTPLSMLPLLLKPLLQRLRTHLQQRLNPR
jgi:hypothetical protein